MKLIIPRRTMPMRGKCMLRAVTNTMIPIAQILPKTVHMLVSYCTVAISIWVCLRLTDDSIIKDFYLPETDETNRPRVFGMTASPIDAKADVTQAANELETLLHSRIATTQDMSLTDAAKRPEEKLLRYASLAQPF